ncbi:MULTISPECIES: hypothetical protein [Mycolicibacterium]|uniref:Uncharacterized protein n=1 Tax=Mycolicibacterium nivoides TaxID=2487344 RepID=A0ABW9LN62_9MYCO|nr:hypothetical protein [Mycolicibacterium fortuitum]UBV13401.1 hypothetical protein H8Z57_21500 [Mycolicibacterium fortuitum]
MSGEIPGVIVGPRGVTAMYGNGSGTICQVLDGVRIRLYPNAVIPVALAHSSAALPLGVGQSGATGLGAEGRRVAREHPDP